MTWLQANRAALVIALIATFGVGLALGDSLSSFKGTPRHLEDPPPPVTHEGERIVVPPGSQLRSELVVEPVGVTDRAHALVLPAAVEADPARSFNILPPVAGKIVDLRVKLGDHVVKGQPLVVIDSGDLAQAYADDDKAREEVRRTSRVLERARNLNRTGSGAIKDLEQAETDYEEARAEATRTEARLREIGVQRGEGGSRKLTLLAPATGSVIALTCAAGAFANDTTASLMTIANLDSVWVTASVPESAVAEVAKGLPVDVTFPAYPGETLHGNVAFVSDVIESDTRRCKVRVVFPNPSGRLKPNMFASASFRIPQPSAVSVPNSALLMNNDSTVVYVEVEPWTFVRRPVVPGFGESDGSRISEGLRPGERVIVKGGILLND